MSLRAVVIALRLVLAALSVAGVVTGLVTAVQTHFDLVSFFSYFTTLSNLFGSAVFVVGAVLLWRSPETRSPETRSPGTRSPGTRSPGTRSPGTRSPGKESPRAEVAPAVRGASVLYLAFVGLVFNTLLVGADLGDLQPWVNVVHHMVMPLAVVVDWLVQAPRRRIGFGMLWPWMAPVAAYVVYSLVRGAATGFYPYPFFNPARVGGYGGVTLYCLAMLVGFVVLALLVRWSGNALDARRSRRAPAVSAR